MVSLRYFVLVLLTICCRELVAERSGFENPYAVPLVVAFVLCIVLITKFAALKAVHGATLAGSTFDWLARELFFASRRKIESLWCYASPLALLVFGWIKLTCALEVSGWPQSLAILLCFTPTFVFLLAVELVATQVERMGQARFNTTMLQSWLTRIRLGETAGVLTCLAPVVLLALVSDLSLWLSTIGDLDPSITRSICTALVVGIFIMLFPLILTAWSAGKPLPESVSERVTRLVGETRVRGIRPVLISSNGRWAGAAVVGWFPGFRRLWLGDGLLSVLTPKEIDMVVLHEIAHVTRYHFFWRLMPVCWAMAAGAGIWLVGNYLDMGESLATKLLAGLASSWIMLAGLGSVARRCELDADRTACDLARFATDWGTTQSPASALSSALSKLLEGSSGGEVTWLHPSLDQRLDSLSQWNSTCDPSVIANA